MPYGLHLIQCLIPYLFVTVWKTTGSGQLLHALSEGVLSNADQVGQDPQHSQRMNILLNFLLSLFSAPEPHPLLCALIAGE